MNDDLMKQRLEFLHCTEDTHRYLDTFNQLLDSEIDHMLDHLYEQIFKIPELKALFPGSQEIENARAAQKRHWMDVVFSKDFGEKYSINAERIGVSHERIGLTIGWYLDGYCLMANEFVRLAIDHCHDDVIGLTKMIQAINRAVFLDIRFVIESYLEKKNEAMRDILVQVDRFAQESRLIDRSLDRESASMTSAINQLGSLTTSLQSSVATLQADLGGANDSAIPDSVLGPAKTGADQLGIDVGSLRTCVEELESNMTALSEKITGLSGELIQQQAAHKLNIFVGAAEPDDP